MILTRDGKEITAIYSQDGSEVEDLKDANGRLVYLASREITGTLPLSFSGRGKPLTDYLISGNTLQNGTPTPEAPVDVAGCGVRTGNLWSGEYIKNLALVDGSFVELNDRCLIFVPIIGGNSYTFSIKSLKDDTIIQSAFSVSKPADGVSYKINGVSTFVNHGQTTQFTRTAPAVANWLAVQVKYVDNLSNDIMLNLGSTALPYEPYGYKIPPTVNGAEYPIYLGQVETTRRIKKLVLTGEENWSRHTDTGTFDLAISGSDAAYLISGEVTCICTHYPAQNNTPSYSQMADKKICMCANSSNVWIRDTDYLTSADFKSYLAAQYAAGTPVTVWYVLAEPETAIVNEPLMKVGDYADTISFAQAGVMIPTVTGTNVLDMTSPVKPSEVYIKGKGIKPTNDPNFENGG